MIHVRHNRGVIFAGRGWRGLLHRWRTRRNDKIQKRLKEEYERYKAGFLKNQHEISRHWKEDVPPRQEIIALPAHNPLRRFHNPQLAEYWR